MLRFILAITVASLVVSCDKLGNSSKQEAPAPGNPPAAGSAPGSAGSPTGTTPALPDLSGAADKAKAAAEDAKKSAESAGAELKKTADSGAEKAKEVVATAKDEGAKAVEGAKDAAKDITASIPELGSLTEGSFSVDKLKSMIGNFKPEQLKGIADKLLAAVQDKQGLVKSLTEQIGKLGIGDVAKSADLTKQLSSAKDLLGGLTGKLQVVVDKLKASGLDVTKYVSALTGN